MQHKVSMHCSAHFKLSKILFTYQVAAGRKLRSGQVAVIHCFSANIINAEVKKQHNVKNKIIVTKKYK